MSLDELETAVARLPEKDLAAFTRWFEESLADAWDQRIEADIKSGRLDKAGRKADAEFEARSQNVSADQVHFALSPERWEKFRTALDASPKVLPALRDLLKQPDVFNDGTAPGQG